MNIHDLREAQVRFEQRREEVLKAREPLYKIRNLFVKHFSLSRLKTMEVDEYVLGVELPQKGFNFCYGLERELDGLGRIIGATAFKFGIYYGRTNSDEKYKYRFTRKFGSNHKEAFEGVRESIIELIVAAEKRQLEIIARNRISPMFKGKILCTYFPDAYLNVFSPDHLNYFLVQLDLDTEELISADAVYKREALVKFKNQDIVMREWSLDLFSNFLYTEYPGRPPRENTVSNDNSDPLADYRTPDFAPNPQPSFVTLEMLLPKTKGTGTTRNKESERKNKPDYEKEHRKFRKLGDRGEKIVLDLERKRLEEEGKKDLSKRVARVSLKSDSFGYDILSFDADGSKRFIEVKATSAKIGSSQFYLTANELAVAEDLKNYYIYIVFDVTSKHPKVWAIKNPFFPAKDNIIKTPMNYRVVINAVVEKS